MSLFISSLNSGSNGNCYYIGNNNEAILVDAGISCREVERRMKRLDLEPSRIKAIFVSHEHGDHITGIPALSKKYRVPVYITDDTLRSAAIPIEEELIQNFKAYQSINIGGLAITPFPKSHDAIDPHSFMVEGGGVRVGVFTDIGSSCRHVIHHFGQCDAAFLESNYCEQMLENGSYPYHLKQRIRGGKGHLSNKEALQLFRKYKGSQLRVLILSHLSRNNNSPDIVDDLFKKEAGEVQIVVASRYKETPVYPILPSSSAPGSKLLQPAMLHETIQLSLFQ
jgi:phosphoribosyl 1,2-cyclic phosphodiesterase